ncbi:transposable element Tcb2 transposase [Trichonephila clavipes]|uniref:Transposable element Tcb2 transposase n=1 Tax=Trichonephila clavipes TaxID=2585209 RepID=A0A8X6WCF4_TRICX|nr:transposable element Tcb2 transposase [Trichonephila clavipes]
MSQRRRLPNSLRWRAVGWMEMGLSQADAARQDLFQADHELQHLALSARRRRTTTVSQLVADYFQASGRRISLLRCEIVFTMQVCMKTSCVRSPQRTTAKEPLMLGKRTCFLDAATMGFCAVSRFTMESDSGRLLIWREQRTRYHQSTLLKDTLYLVESWFGQGSRLATLTCNVFHGGKLVLDIGMRSLIHMSAHMLLLGNDFILMDDNARPHRARIVEEYLVDHGLERMEWPARSPDLQISWQRGCCFKSSSKVVT